MPKSSSVSPYDLLSGIHHADVADYVAHADMYLYPVEVVKVDRGLGRELAVEETEVPELAAGDEERVGCEGGDAGVEGEVDVAAAGDHPDGEAGEVRAFTEHREELERGPEGHRERAERGPPQDADERVAHGVGACREQWVQEVVGEREPLDVNEAFENKGQVSMPYPGYPADDEIGDDGGQRRVAPVVPVYLDRELFDVGGEVGGCFECFVQGPYVG